MLIGEPPPSQGDFHFRLFGIPVRVHPFFWLIGVLLVARPLFAAPDLRAGLTILLPWMVAFFVAILVHELGHAVVMRAYGFSPWITLYGLGGLASYNPGQSYGSRGSGTWGQVLISLAGPGAGFLLAALVVAGIVFAGPGVHVLWIARFLPLVIPAGPIGTPALTRLLVDLLQISVFWGILNLMPLYPLDGGQIARELLQRWNPREGIRQSLMLSVFTGVCLAVLGAVVLRDLLFVFLFGYLAYVSYVTLQAYSGRGGWR